jgi:hypothetical protein
MLGCQDFCGYYDWTFHHVRQCFGPGAVEALWAEAIGGESQAHYLEAAQQGGLAGLLEVWTHTGEDERCDWTFTLDEQRNVLRWDMRQCPSKGFLQANDLAADEDYCDHCMGWTIPLLAKAGVQVNTHEHNHCGQCWAEISVAGHKSESLNLDIDIHKDPRWNLGYVERWSDNRKLPISEQGMKAADFSLLLIEWFAKTDHLLVLGRGPGAREPWASQLPRDAVLITDTSYAKRDVFEGDPLGVLIGDGPRDLRELAARYNATSPEQRPLLMHTYLPLASSLDFVSAGLPRPVPVLPLLIHKGLYQHRPAQPYPTTGVFMVLLAAALGKQIDIAGIDLYHHPSGLVYAGQNATADEFTLPTRHSLACDVEHLRRAVNVSSSPTKMPSHLRRLLDGHR